jgi:hypothetical protein
MAERAEVLQAQNDVRKDKYLKTLATVQQAIAQSPHGDNSTIDQQFQILEALLMKEVR